MPENKNILESVVGALLPGGKETTDQLKQLGDQVETKQNLQDLSNQVEGKQEPEDLMENSSLSPGGKKLYRFFRDVVLPFIDPKKEWTGHVDMFAAKCLGIKPPTIKEAEEFAKNLLTKSRAMIALERSKKGKENILAAAFLQSEKDPAKMSNGTFAQGESYVVNYHENKEVIESPFFAGDIIGDLKVVHIGIETDGVVTDAYRMGYHFFTNPEGKGKEVKLVDKDKITMQSVLAKARPEDEAMSKETSAETIVEKTKELSTEKFGDVELPIKEINNKTYVDAVKAEWKKLPESTKEEKEQKNRMLSFVEEGYFAYALDLIESACPKMTEDKKPALFLKVFLPTIIEDQSGFDPKKESKEKFGLLGVPSDGEKKEEVVGEKKDVVKANLKAALKKMDGYYEKAKTEYKEKDSFRVMLDLYENPGRDMKSEKEGSYAERLAKKLNTLTAYKEAA